MSDMKSMAEENKRLNKRVYQIYRELELNLRIKPRRRLVREKPDKLSVPEIPNETWSRWVLWPIGLATGEHFVHSMYSTILTREGLGIEVDVSLPSERVTRALDHIIEWRGKPKVIRWDNGPEYITETWLRGLVNMG